MENNYGKNIGKLIEQNSKNYFTWILNDTLINPNLEH